MLWVQRCRRQLLTMVMAAVAMCLLLPLPWTRPALAAPQGNPPWGDLIKLPIVISPPLEYIPTDAGPIQPPRWYFPQVTPDRLQEILATVGFSSREVATLAATAQPDVSMTGLVLTPNPDFVRQMPATVRGKLYELLTQSPANYAQQAAYRFHGTLDSWLGQGLLPKTRALVDPLVYQAGDFLVFADIELVRGQIGKGPELQALVKRMLRQSTLLLSLRVDDESELDGLAEYWGRGGRKTDIRPLLESVAGDETAPTIDVIHLLPELARRLLYRYPKIRLEDLKKSQLANCFWTALNFFNDQPDDRVLEASVALKRLATDYYIVQDKFQLGDVVAFSDHTGSVFHVAVYVADDIVFTKNGYFALAPWSLLPIDRLKGHYPMNAVGWQVSYYRRKDL